MTETTMEAVERAEPAIPPPDTLPSAPAPRAVEQSGTAVEHTPGGYPVLPLTLSGVNSAAGLVGAAGLSGGPVAAAGAAAGAALFGVAAAARSRRAKARNGASTTRSAAAPSGARRRGSAGAARTGRAGGPRSGPGGRGRSPAGSGRAAGKRSAAGSRSRPGGSAASRSAHRAGGISLRKGQAAAGSGAGGTRGRGAAGGRVPGGRVGQVRGLRADKARQSPSRSAARQQQTRDRRNVADARRQARQAARVAKAAQHGGRGPVGRSTAWAGRQAAAGARRAVDRARSRRDRANDREVAAKRSAVRKAPARRAARWALAKSAARFHGRRVLAGLLAGVAGTAGLATSPLGRKLGLPALVRPGRRLYRRLMLSARASRTERDTAIREQRQEAEAAADAAPEDDIKDRVERPTHLTPRIPSPPVEVRVSGFKFEEAAAEMEQAARTYDPDGNMEVVAMVDNLPQAMESIAKTFLTLAERADGEFAFEKEVAAAFDDIYKTLMSAVDGAEDLTKAFRQVHAADIARHEDPRNGTEAEKGWNV